MKKQLCFIVMSIVFVYIYSSYSCINEIKRKKYVQNTHEKINNNFSLERTTLKDETLSVYEYTTNSTGYLLCEGIEKLTWTNNFKYIIGYIELSKQGLCKGYFYINSNDEKDYKFNLTKKEVEEKFGKDIKYQKSIDFINIFGENSFNEENISEIISFYELVTFFGSILLYILLNILNSIMYIIKIINVDELVLPAEYKIKKEDIPNEYTFLKNYNLLCSTTIRRAFFFEKFTYSK